MRDERERSLRREAEGSADQALAELLRERVRSGSLSRRALEHAAWIGFGPAGLALGLVQMSLEDVASRLHALPLSASVRAALTASEALGAEACGVCWEAAARWAADPCSEHHAAARALLEAGEGSRLELKLLAGLVQSNRGRLRQIVEEAGSSIPDLDERVREALVPWLLGGVDPLAGGASTWAPPWGAGA